MPEEQTKHQVRAFLLNKREAYERDLKESSRDGWKEEIDPFINSIQNDYDSIYNRRKEIEGFGM